MRSKPIQKNLAHRVRIIGGKWKRTLLPVCSVKNLRPTPNRVRETVFNWLFSLLGGKWESCDVLDLFAGTGALGFEAASRGAKSVVLVEENKEAHTGLLKSKDKLKADNVDVILGDARLTASRFIQENRLFDIIFLDPPFSENVWDRILPICEKLLKENGFLYVESPESLDHEILKKFAHGNQEWHIMRKDRAGKVFYHLLHFETSLTKA